MPSTLALHLSHSCQLYPLPTYAATPIYHPTYLRLHRLPQLYT